MSRLSQLAINEEGFVFDPTTGEAFTCNKTGLAVLRCLKEGKDCDEIAVVLHKMFDVDFKDAAHDVFDFIDHLRVFKILAQGLEK
ncbi:MAG: PqqD family protein [Rhodospirillaceae bacterium]